MIVEQQDVGGRCLFAYCFAEFDRTGMAVAHAADTLEVVHILHKQIAGKVGIAASDERAVKRRGVEDGIDLRASLVNGRVHRHLLRWLGRIRRIERRWGEGERTLDKIIVIQVAQLRPAGGDQAMVVGRARAEIP